MKSLKFAKNLIPKILSGEKTSTWRLFDDKNLEVGDKLELLVSGRNEVFANSRITKISEKLLGELTGKDWVGHERFGSEEEMYQKYSEYYQREVTPKDKVKLISFELIREHKSYPRT